MKTIFVSSTFKDMHFERDAIQEITLPLLKAEAGKYGENISFCDLRWGINTGDLDSEEGSRKVLDVCLDEIDRCKPPFVVILGDRYGWIPSEDLTEHAADRKKLDKFALQKQMELDDLKMSVTALEIGYGALSTEERQKQALFYFRHIESDCPSDYAVEDKEHAQKLDRLKAKIKKLTGGQIRHYSVRWDGEKLDGVIPFAEMLAEDIARILLPEWKQKELLTPFERERLTHWSFITEKNEMFSARSTLVQKYYDDLTQNGKHFLAIKAPSGSGKSMIFSNLALRFREGGYDVIPFVSGLTSESNDSMDILRNTIYYIEDLLELSHERIDSGFGNFSSQNEEQTEKKSNIDKLRQRLFELCAECEQAKKRIVIMVDAVDQLAADDNRDNLVFIPERLSENVKFVMTCLPELEISGWDAVTLNPINDTEKREVIEGILKSHNRELEEKVIRKMIRSKSSSNPLFLSLLVQRLLMMNREDFIAIKAAGDGMNAITEHQLQIIKTCPDSLQKMSASLLHEAGKRINEALVRSVAEYLAVSRHGLRREDLAALLGDQWSALDFAHFISYMDESFIQRDDGRFDFSHKCIREGFLELCSNAGEIHRQITEHFENLSPTDTVRMQELVYHLIEIDGKARFADYIRQITNSGEAKEYAVKDLFSHSMRDGGTWFCALLENGAEFRVTADMCQFVNLYFDQNISGTLDEMRMRIAVLDANVQLAEKLTDINNNEVRMIVADTYMRYAESRQNIDRQSYNAFRQHYWNRTEYYEKAFIIYNERTDCINNAEHIIKLTRICKILGGFKYIVSGISIAKHFLEEKRNALVEIELAGLYLHLLSLYNGSSAGIKKANVLMNSMSTVERIENYYITIPSAGQKQLAEVYLSLARQHPLNEYRRICVEKYFNLIKSLADNTNTLNEKMFLASAYMEYSRALHDIEDIDGAIKAIESSIALHKQIYQQYGLKSSIALSTQCMMSLANEHGIKYGANEKLKTLKKAVYYLFEQLKNTDDLVFLKILWILDEVPNDYSFIDKFCVKIKILKNCSLLIFEAFRYRGKFVKIRYPMWLLYGQISQIFHDSGLGSKLTYKILKNNIKNRIKDAKREKNFKWRCIQHVANAYGEIADICRTLGGCYKLLAIRYAAKSVRTQKRAIHLCKKECPQEEAFMVSSLAHQYRELGYCYEMIGWECLTKHYYKKELSTHDLSEKMKPTALASTCYDTYSILRLANIYYKNGNATMGDQWFQKNIAYNPISQSQKHIFCKRWDGEYWAHCGYDRIYGFIEERKSTACSIVLELTDPIGWDPSGRKRKATAIHSIAHITRSRQSLVFLRNTYKTDLVIAKYQPEMLVDNYERCVEIDLKIAQRYPDADWQAMLILDYNDLLLLHLYTKKPKDALKCGLKAMTLLEAIIEKNHSCEFMEDLSSIYRNIGEVYIALSGDDNAALAMEYFKKSIAVDEQLFNENKLNNPYVTLMLSYRRMGLLCEQLKRFDEAKLWHSKAFAILIMDTPKEGVVCFSKWCFISNLLEIAEKNYLTNEEKIMCYENAIGGMKWVAENRGAQWNFYAPIIIKSLEKKIQALGGN